MTIKFNNTLQDLLKNQNLSALASELDISKSVLHDWKNGRLPSFKNIEQVQRLASYLGLTLEELILGTKSEKKTISSVSFEDEGRKYKVSIERIK